MTTRRDFLKAGAALAAGAALPLPPEQVWEIGPTMTLADLQRILRKAAMPAVDEYVAFVHPSNWRSIREYEARGRWELAYRRYRIARRENVCGYLPPREIIQRFTEVSDEMLDDMRAQMRAGEIGRYESFRFITHEPEVNWP